MFYIWYVVVKIWIVFKCYLLFFVFCMLYVIVFVLIDNDMIKKKFNYVVSCMNFRVGYMI